MKDYKKFGDCPVCKTECKLDEDIVVCPECGAPYHRDCYNSLGQCMYQEKHSENFSYRRTNVQNNAEGNKNNQTFDNDSTANSADTKKCPRCFIENSSDARCCNNCGYPFSFNDNNPEIFNEIPMAPQFDFLFGMDKDETINDIKISEFAQYVKVNLFYYLSVFKNINEKNKNKFNFSAFIFSGGWFLYRKLYKIGIALTLTTILLSIFSTFIELTYANDILISLFKLAGISSSLELTLDKCDALLNHFYALPFAQKFTVFLPTIINFINFAIMIVSGFIANKVYYKNCCSKIKKIKNLCKDDKKLFNNEINKFGGINFKAIPFILLNCYIIFKNLFGLI